MTEELKIKLLGDTPHARVVDTESYELTLQGRYLFNRRSEGDLVRAFDLFERAVELDPNNATAWVGISPLYMWLFDPPRLDDMLVATERAITLDPDNPEAWSRHAMANWQTGKSEAGYEAWNRAIELGDESPLIQGQISGRYANQGDLERAIEAGKRAVALDPLYVTNIGNLATFLIMAGRLDEAEEYINKAAALAPNSFHMAEQSALINLLQGPPGKSRRDSAGNAPTGI